MRVLPACRLVRKAAAPLFLLVVLALPAHGWCAERIKSQITHVLELFTSQGCSSCPPADDLLARFADAPHVLALSYHVDYWDYIGWRDTFGSGHNSERQRAYARSFANKMIYTPQLVINGLYDVVGSHAEKIRRLMAKSSLPAATTPISLGVKRVGDSIHITASGIRTAPGEPKPMLVLVSFADRAEVSIERGENRGRTLATTHPVRSWQLMGMVGEDGMAVDMPLSSVMPDGEETYGCAVLVQAVRPDGSPGAILAATQMEVDPD
ncbi:DUF1223 domain-containing protein [Jiella sonneratiae]|uniref:DUF1223 domain-containing protein n=1 Tax=Jiella sonneratiae TaxID=2816856 RepID=A0ABS3J4R4_9HYPH|nr:DUF1223 domain-containing protein [Jiella sonneratiae]MBO0904647.1 DUF1223 domain-containing protein [Jiella sonneratiae]